MLISMFFTDQGAPTTGLTPTIDIWLSDGSSVVSSASMSEVDGGFYYFDFTSYDDDLDYFIRADAGPSLSDTDRYIAGTNEIGQVTSQLTLQDTALSYILGLVQSNFRIQNQTYDGNGNLTAAKISIYPSAIETDNDVNPLATYTVSASYGASGNLTDYKVTQD